MPKLMLLPMELLRCTKKKRRGICEHRIEELRIALEMGEDIPPIRVNLMEDGTFVVKDGRHRLAAHKAAYMTQIWAIVENIIGRLLRRLPAKLARDLLQVALGRLFFFYTHSMPSPSFRNLRDSCCQDHRLLPIQRVYEE
jgi:hypothetical protein